MLGENQMTDEVTNENEEVVEQQNLDESHATEDDTASTDTIEDQDKEHDEDTTHDESDDYTDDSEAQPRSKGLDKRLSKVLERSEQLQSRLWEVERELALSKQAQQIHTQYQQSQQQQQFLDPRLDPKSDQFDLILFTGEIAKQQLLAQQSEIKKQEMAKSVINEFGSVEEKLSRARAIDPSFDKAMQRYEAVLTPDMKYGLSALDNPVAYLKHIFKNEKDVRALQQISIRHPSEQVKTITKLGLQFELKNPGRKSNAPSTPKPKPPIPQLGSKGRAASKPAFDTQTGRYDRDWINNWVNS